MKSITNILLKLFGLIFLYWGLEYLVNIAIFIPQSKQILGFEIFGISSIVGSTLYALITFTISLLLLARTEKMAKLLGLKNEEINFGVIAPEQILSTGSKLIGLFIFVLKIGTLIKTITLFLYSLNADKTIYLPAETHRLVSRATSKIEIIAQALPIILSLFLIFKSNALIKFINEVEKDNLT